MRLPPGTRLGSYEISAQIGAGGMGEVYRATDSNLKRAVAIKILPASVAGDADRLARFQREAEVLAALNHPNIGAIYGLEKTADSTALVMELIDGEDLSAHIAREPMPVADALRIARQIADALEAAHEQGIIHRDLKPANIKVRADGTVKVLDFGLAKAMDPAGASSVAVMNSPTLTVRATQMGVILGTAGYMAPEQARGRAVDRRADIWAFGAVLYEMLTGVRAFPGDDITDTLAAVVRAEPDWSLVPKGISPTLLAFLRRCLEKDPRQRVGDFRDVRLALDGAFEIAAPQTGAGSTPASRRLLTWVAAAALVMAVALAVPAVRHLRESAPPAPPEIRTEIVAAGGGAFALSPDGRQLVFEATIDGVSRLWLRPLSETGAQPLAGTEDATDPFWSPDSRSIAFFRDGLKRLDLGGGAPRMVVSGFPRGSGTWGADDVILLGDVRGRGLGSLRRVSAMGGTATTFAPLGEKVSHFTPSFLPDGRRFLFTVVGQPDVAGIYLGTLDGNVPTRLTPDVGPAALYVPAGGGPAETRRGSQWLLWGRAGAIVGQRFDAATRALTGEPTTLGQRSGLFSAVNGLIAYRPGGPGGLRRVTWFDGRGTQLETVGEPGDLRNLSLSPDGKSLAMSVGSADSTNSDIWILELPRGLRTRFTFTQARETRPVWSPDGGSVVFSSSRSGHADIYRKSVDGAVGSEELLYADDRDKEPLSYSPDGKYLLYSSTDPKTKSNLWVLPLTGDRKPFAFAQTEFVESAGTFSPDGRWIAYVSDESGSADVYAAPFPGPGGKRLISTKQAGVGQGGVPVWSPDGKEIFYIAPDRTLMAVSVRARGTTLDAGLARKLFGPIPSVGGRNYAVSPDGKRFLTYTAPGARPDAPITLIQNWNPEAVR